MTDTTRNEGDDLLEGFAELVADLAQGAAVRFGRVGIRGVVVGDDLARVLGVTRDEPRRVMTATGPVQITAEPVNGSKTTMLDAIRARYSATKTLLMSDVSFLLSFAVNDYDMSAESIAENVENILELGGDFVEKAYQKLDKITAIGPVIAVDTYVCDVDQLQVKVERVPGTDDVRSGRLGANLQDELLDVAPQCPGCEREMTKIGRKFRNI